MNPMTAAALREARASVGRAATAIDLVSVTGGEPALLRDPRRGFRDFGDFAYAVMRSGNGAACDERLSILAAAPSTVGSEGVGQDGGFAVPPTFADQIFALVMSGDALVPLCDQQESSTNSMEFPTDETMPWGSTGIRATWQLENISLTQLKPQLRTTSMRMCKLACFVPLSDELVADARGLNTYLPQKTGDAISWRLNDAIVRGLGNGQPLGILNATATVVQAKDSGQATNTFTITNATNMLSRLPPGSHSRAVWLVDMTTVPVLLSMGASASGYPIFVPSDDLIRGTNIPMNGRLLGRPVIITAHTNALSTQGDVVLADFKYYRTLMKPGGLQTALSMHVFFDADMAAFRATLRVDGMPAIANPIAAPKGATTLSPFIQLAAR